MKSERPFLSHFSPQWTQPEYLEAILVQRGDLLAESVAVVRDSVLTGRLHHLLFIGPRGAGKTHLVTLIQHRLKQDDALSNRMRIAWLNEDETATSFLRLLIAIYRSLSERYPEEFPAATITALSGKEPGLAQEQLSQALLRDLNGRSVVCIMENLDSLFRSLDVAEQRNWRAFLQNHPVMTIVGTAQTLFGGIADHDEPFYGFFDTRHLQPLTVEEASDLLERIATLHGRTDLADFLRTSTGRARVDAIRALAGGNPRLYLIFSDLLVDAAALDDLVRPFEEMVDRQLTSYYQERLRWLSPQQREIIQFLCRSRSPVPVKQIADGLFTTHNSITGQLKQLREMRYVDSHPLGREVFYELAEPLMRLALLVKETHDRRPLALIVDFLRVWHERGELEDRLANCAADSPGRAYLETAHRLLLTEPNLRHELFRRDLDFADPEQCDDTMLEKARCLADESGLPADRLRLSWILLRRQEWDSMIRECSQLIRCKTATPSEKVRAKCLRGKAYFACGRDSKAVGDLSSVIKCPDAPTEDVAMALVLRGMHYREFGKANEAIDDFTRAIGLPGLSPILAATASIHRGFSMMEASQHKEAVADFTQGIETHAAPPELVAMALINRGQLSGETGQHEEAIADYSRVIDNTETPPLLVAVAINNRVIAYDKVGDFSSVLADILALFSLPEREDRMDLLHDCLPFMAVKLVKAVFAVTSDPARWKSLLIEFAGYFARFDGLSQLGEAAVKHLPKLAESPLNHAAWDAWADAWEAARASLPEADRDKLDIPLRLLRAGIGWLKTKDEAHLLSLPREERQILRDALGLSKLPKPPRKKPR